MSFILRCLFGITLAASLGSCATTQRFGQACDNILTVRVTPYGTETEIHPNVTQTFDCFFTTPELKQQYPPNLGNGWQNVTGDYYLSIPYGQGGANYWLLTHGNVVEAWYTYNGERRDIPRGSWAFHIDNCGDGGLHELVIGWKYAGNNRTHTRTRQVRNNSIR